MERYFEKVSFEEFAKAYGNNNDIYNEYNLPYRSTSTSAGYDFFSIEKRVIKPNEIVKIPTGYKVKMKNNEVLLLYVRSSMGFKYNIRMCNQVGIIDSDYYNNENNEGHIYVALQNEGNKDYVIEKGDAFCQGIFMNFLTCGEENKKTRVGGIGSTNKKEGNKNE